jgi:RNA polymerase sigma-70 factor (ECF subfamily)
MDLELSDADALRRSLAEPSEFAVVYERHLGRVLSYLRRRLGDGAAEDLSAEVFARAFRARARYGVQHDTALPWLLGIASNLIADHRRAERRRLAALAKLAAQPDLDRQPSDEPRLSAELADTLRQLPVADRDALLLIAWGELTYAEAAQALDVPIGTVRSRVARARSRLTGSDNSAPRARSAEVLTNGESHA